MSFSERLVRLRTLRCLPVKELAALTGIAYPELVRLEGGAGRTPSADVTRRLADFFNTTGEYLVSGQGPGPAALRAGFYRYYDSLGAEERQGLKFAPIQARVEAVLRFMESAYPGVLDRTQVAARLGYTPQALVDVLQGAAPLESHLLKLLVNLTGLSLEFFVRGDFFGGVVSQEPNISPARLSEYYQVVQEAIAAGISPAALRKAVQIMSIRDLEH